VQKNYSLHCPETYKQILIKPNNSGPITGAEYCDVYVCLCVSVCKHISSEIHAQPAADFRACYPWPWFGRPLAALRCVLMYFRFYG